MDDHDLSRLCYLMGSLVSAPELSHKLIARVLREGPSDRFAEVVSELDKKLRSLTEEDTPTLGTLSRLANALRKDETEDLRIVGRILSLSFLVCQPQGRSHKPGPLRPEDVKKIALPDEVYEIFNTLIKENWNGRCAVITTDEAAIRIARAMHTTKTEVYAKGWLDVEAAYQKAGWKVEYDQPGYCEDYVSTFRFSK